MGRGGLTDQTSAVAPAGGRIVQAKTVGMVFESGAAAMLLWNSNHLTVDANKSACRLLGRTRNSLLNLRLDDLTPRNAIRTLDQMCKSLTDHGNGHGHHVFALPTGEEIRVFYAVTANIMPGVNLGIFHPDKGEPISDPLSDREREIMTLLARGENNRTIAGKLFLAPETVRNYTRSAREKLGAKSRSHAISLALTSGQISLSD